MAEAKEKFKDEIERFIVLQYIFDKQWKAVRVSCHTLFLRSLQPNRG